MRFTCLEHWFLLLSGRCNCAYNMAMDEALMQLTPELGAPVLRFYGWTELAASFGYFQKIAEIERATNLRPLVRRPTGGGLVPHDADWTYSVAVPPSHPWYQLRAEQSYERAHRWVQAAFARLGVSTELAPCARLEGPGQCFVGYEKHDVLQGGRKIAGAAQRRTKTGLLIQGSIQPQPRGISRHAWELAMCGWAAQEWQMIWDTLQPDGKLEECAKDLALKNYSQETFNRKR
jgi:lipoate-protein ligase A